MENLSRWQTMQTSFLLSGTQSFRAGGWSGGWNFAGKRRFFSVQLRSLSLSDRLEEGVWVGVLSTNNQTTAGKEKISYIQSCGTIKRFNQTTVLNVL